MGTAYLHLYTSSKRIIWSLEKCVSTIWVKAIAEFSVVKGILASPGTCEMVFKLWWILVTGSKFGVSENWDLGSVLHKFNLNIALKSLSYVSKINNVYKLKNIYFADPAKEYDYTINKYRELTFRFFL